MFDDVRTCTCAGLVMSCQACLAPAVLGLACRAMLAWRAICKFLMHVAGRSPCRLLFHVPLSRAEGATACAVAIPNSLPCNHVATRVP